MEHDGTQQVTATRLRHAAVSVKPSGARLTDNWIAFRVNIRGSRTFFSHCAVKTGVIDTHAWSYLIPGQRVNLGLVFHPGVGGKGKVRAAQAAGTSYEFGSPLIASKFNPLAFKTKVVVIRSPK